MFSSKSERNSPRVAANPAMKSMASPGGTFSVIGPDVTIRGDIEASVDLHVDGKVIGNISCASLVQGESSRVEGEIKAESARLSGEVQGTIEVRNLVLIDYAPDGSLAYARSRIFVSAPAGACDWLNARVFVGTLEVVRPQEQVRIRSFLLA